MKRRTLIAILAAIMVMASAVCSWAAGGLELVSSYPEDGQTNTSMENAGVKLQFNNAVNSKEAKAVNEKAIRILGSDGKTVPTQILFDDDEKGLVLAVVDIDEGYMVQNNSEYKCVIDADFVDNDGNTLGKETTITFKTYNQKLNNAVNMGMMVVMFGGIFFFSFRQNNKKKEEDEPVKQAVNPYKEAKRTGKSVDEVKAELAKKEAKEAKKRARKKADEPTEKKIENCAELLNNVYHVHAPAPTNKEDRSVEALKKMRRAEKAAAKAEAAAKGKKKSTKKK